MFSVQHCNPIIRLCSARFVMMKAELPVSRKNRRWIEAVDAFKTVPKELTESSAIGVFMTLIAIISCAVLFLCEASAYLYARHVTNIEIDSNQDAALRINFDVHMFKVSDIFKPH